MALSAGPRRAELYVTLCAAALLGLEAWRAAGHETERFGRASFEHRLHLLRTGADERLRTGLGPHAEALAAVGVYALDATRLVVVNDGSEADLLLVARMSSLLFPLSVIGLLEVPEDAAELTAWMGSTTYVLHLHPERFSGAARRLERLADGPGWVLLHARGDG